MDSQKYFSTRSSNTTRSFEEAVIEGLAPDGGLYIPQGIPKVDKATLNSWKDLSFVDLAYEVLSLYISQEEIPSADLKSLLSKSYSTFRSKEVTPVKELNKDKNLYLLELFHGPTYAFKDVALQFVGNLFEYFLTRKNASKAPDAKDRDIITVIGATSGDTGSAAIYGLRNKKDVSVFILYPEGRVSPIQEAQMTTVLDENVHTISVKGTFDDCQAVVKKAFADEEFNKKYHVGAVNSINWSRILAQMTYYFYSYFQLVKQTGEAEPKVKFVVPTGNFGDILAGFYAKRMGLPCELVVATNQNDILYRFFESGAYSKSASKGSDPVVYSTLSPAMDILVSSNFERFLWYMASENVAKSYPEAGLVVKQWMDDLKTKGSFTVPQEAFEAAKKEYTSERTTDDQTTQTINKVYTEVSPKYILDPHSAVAVHAALQRIEKDSSSATNYVALSTAHPAKFADAVDVALKGVEGFDFENDVLPQQFKDFSKMERKNLYADEPTIDAVKQVIIKELS